MIIKKNSKASEIDVYREQILTQGNGDDGGYLQICDNGFILFVSANKLRKEELESFNYRTKKMGYITDNNGMISLIIDNVLCTEMIWYPYPEQKDIINNVSPSMSVVLIDPSKDKVMAIKELIIPASVFDKLKEQWNISINSGITFQQYQDWAHRTLYSHSCHYNSSIAEEKQVAREIKAENIFLCI